MEQERERPTGTTRTSGDSPAAPRAELLARYRHLTCVVLPERARREGWVVHADHCFQRIVLDHAVGAAWKTVLTGRKPAWRQASDADLAAAVGIAEAIAAGGDAVLRALDGQSLAWRGKRASDTRTRTRPLRGSPSASDDAPTPITET